MVYMRGFNKEMLKLIQAMLGRFVVGYQPMP
jgi:hypothetical protein